MKSQPPVPAHEFRSSSKARRRESGHQKAQKETNEPAWLHVLSLCSLNLFVVCLVTLSDESRNKLARNSRTGGAASLPFQPAKLLSLRTDREKHRRGSRAHR